MIKYLNMVCFALTLLLAACAPQYVWQHSTDNNEYRYNSDVSQCDIYGQQEKYRAAQAFGNSPFAGPGMIAAYDRAFENCMYTQGWRKVLKKRKNDNHNARTQQASTGSARLKQEDTSKQKSEESKPQSKRIIEEWGDKPQDGVAMSALLVKEKKKVVVAIIVDDVTYTEVKPDPKLDSVMAVLKDNLSADLENIYLTVYGKYAHFSLIDRMHIEAVLKEHALGQTGLISDEDKVKIGKLIGATHLLLVKKTMLASGEVSSVEYRRLIEVETGKVLAVGITKVKYK